MKLLQKIKGRLPHKLPKGVKDFDSFSKLIFKIYNIPDLPSYRHAIATMIMHIPPQESHASLWFFARSIYKAQANEVAYQILKEINDKEKEEREGDAINIQ